ncbi:MAG: hypothetical protein AAGA83_20325 [Cyanobacteria bacterium P01_F01_bin.116]
MRLDIRELNLGSDSAERDINLGLAEYFYPNITYQKFLSGRKTILVGNRGAGKSAIFKYIATTETRKGHLILELSPELDFIQTNGVKRKAASTIGLSEPTCCKWKY